MKEVRERQNRREIEGAILLEIEEKKKKRKMHEIYLKKRAERLSNNE